jgi:hypothetical protein
MLALNIVQLADAVKVYFEPGTDGAAGQMRLQCLSTRHVSGHDAMTRVRP